MDWTVYNSVKDQMKTGDFLQWRSPGIIGSIIRWKTKSEANHSSMIIRFQEYEGEERRRFHTEAMERGVYPNLLSSRLEQYKGKVWWLPLKPEWDSQRGEIGRRLMLLWGRKYDYRSLVWQLIGKVNADTKQLFCSETCYVALGGKGIAPNPGELEKMGVHSDKILIWDGEI